MLQTTNRRLMALFIAASCVPLLIYAYAAFNARISADDYCVLPIVQKRDLLSSLQFYYEALTGRFTNILTVAIALRLGVTLSSFIPILVMALWWIAIFGAVRVIGRKRGWPSYTLLAATAATVLIITILNSTFGVRDSVYWNQGVLLYTAPLVLLTCYFWLVVSYESANVYLLLLAFLLTFFAAGFSELYAPIQILALAGGTLYCMKYDRRRLSALSVGLVATIVGTLIMLVAPGNYIRLAHNVRPDIVTLVSGTLIGPFATASVAAFIWPFSPLLLIGLPALVGYYLESRKHSHARWYLLVIPVVFGVLTTIPFAVTLVAIGQRPPDRAWIVSEFTLFCGYILWGYFLGVTLRPENARPKLPAILRLVAVVAGIAIVMTTFTKAVGMENALKEFAVAWDQRDAYIQSQVGKTALLTLKPLPNDAAQIGVATNTDFWVNRCMAGYYHIDSIAGDPTVTTTMFSASLLGRPDVP